MRAPAAPLLVLLAVLCAPAGADTPAERSTGQVETTVEPTLPANGVAIELGADEKPVLRDGKATASEYRLFTFRPPPSAKQVAAMLAAVAPRLSTHHAVAFPEPLLAAAVDRSHRLPGAPGPSLPAGARPPSSPRPPRASARSAAGRSSSSHRVRPPFSGRRASSAWRSCPGSPRGAELRHPIPLVA